MGKVPEPRTWTAFEPAGWEFLEPPQSSLTIDTDMRLRERLSLVWRIIRSRHVSFTVSGR